MVEVDKNKELLETYDLREDFRGLMTREDFYKEIEAEYLKTGKITKQVRSVRALIMNTNGRILLQKRSEDKKYNAGLYDKTLGGHCTLRQQSNLALVAELAEELESPGFVCANADFLYNLAHIDLKIIGLFKDVGYQSGFMSLRKGNPEKGTSDIVQPFMNHFYFGVYNGRFSWVDTEVRGMDSFPLDDLVKTMEQKPDQFTEDMKVMLPIYRPHIESVLERFGLK